MSISFFNEFPTPDSSTTDRNTLISFDLVSDNSDSFISLHIIIGNGDIVYEYGSFVSPFDGPNSSITPITGGYSFVIDKTSLYGVGPTRVSFTTNDFSGHFDFTISSDVSISNQLPLPDSIENNECTLISFDVTSAYPILLPFLSIQIDSDSCYNATNFVSPFDGVSSSVTPITDGYTFVIDKTSCFFVDSFVNIYFELETLNIDWQFKTTTTKEVLNKFPVPDSTGISASSLISFDIISDVAFNIDDVIVLVGPLTVNDGINFLPPFNGVNSSITPITDGYSFVIDNTLYYSESFDVEEIIVTVDYYDFEDQWSFYTVSVENIEISNEFPVQDSFTSNKNTLVSFDITSDRPLDFLNNVSILDAPFARYAVLNGIFEAPFDGPSSSITNITNGYRFVIDNTTPYVTESQLFSTHIEAGLHYFDLDFSFTFITIEILNKFPLEASTANKDTLISFDIISGVSLGEITIAVGGETFNYDSIITFGSTVTFTKINYIPAEDIISDAVHITRGNTKGIYNNVIESSYDDEDYTSPLDTEWTYYNIPWGDLSDVKFREYLPWYDAVDGTPPESVNAEMVMHIISEDRYFKVMFKSWTSGGGVGGGGFSYERTEIFVDISVLAPFNGASSSITTISGGYNFIIDKNSDYDVGETLITVNSYDFEEEWSFNVAFLPNFPQIQNKYPDENERGIDGYMLISFDAYDSGSNINPNTFEVYVDETLVFLGPNTFYAPFNGANSAITTKEINGTDGYHIVLDNTGYYPSNTSISVRVIVTDYSSLSINDLWTFRTGNRIISVTPSLYEVVLDVEFEYPFAITSATVEPANYIFSNGMYARKVEIITNKIVRLWVELFHTHRYFTLSIDPSIIDEFGDSIPSGYNSFVFSPFESTADLANFNGRIRTWRDSYVVSADPNCVYLGGTKGIDVFNKHEGRWAQIFNEENAIESIFVANFGGAHDFSETVPPYLFNVSPYPASVAPYNSIILFSVGDESLAVEPTTLVVYVNSIIAFNGVYGGWDNDFTGFVEIGYKHLDVAIKPPAPYAPKQIVNVRVVAEDLLGNQLDISYNYTVASTPIISMGWGLSYWGKTNFGKGEI